MLGTTFGPYRIEELLGRGGMGEVYRAHDVERGRDVALKVLPPHLASDTEYQERFKRECRAAARLNEPHVVPIHTFGEIDGRLFLDMRLVVGMDLASWLKAHGAMPPEAAVSVVSQVAAALDAAHAAGLVHRDVKPSNVLLAGVTGPAVDRDVFAYLFDFGIARAQEGMGDDPALTRAGTMPGSLAYVAPERFSGVEGDPRADVYALACVLHQALTGRPPFEGDLATLMRAHLAAPPPRPTSSRPDLPAGLDQVVAQGMAKEPAARPATAGALAAAARAELGLRTDGDAAPWRATTAPVAAAAAAQGPWSAPQPGYGPTPHPGQGSSPQPYPGPPGYGPQQPAYAPTAVGGYGPPPAGGTSHPSHPSQPAYPAPPGYPAAAPQRPGGRGPLIAIVVLVVLALAGGGITWGVLAGGGGEDLGALPTTDAATSAPATADPTTPPADPTTADPTPAVPTPETERLLADLPQGYGPGLCVADTLPGSAATASVNCNAEPTIGSGPSDAFFARYADVPTMDAEFDGYAAATDPTTDADIGDCASGDPVRVVYTRAEGQLGGQLLCYTDAEGVALLVWTDDAAVGLGVVSNADGDATALYDWWLENDFAAER